jgi:hypothetical protein
MNVFWNRIYFPADTKKAWTYKEEITQDLGRLHDDKLKYMYASAAFIKVIKERMFRISDV